MSKNLTIYDIAEKAGVSHTTVSRIINNRDASISISPKTRDKVLAVIKKYNFHPKVFRGRKTGNIGVVFSLEDVPKPLSDPFYSEVLEGVEEEIKQQKHTMLLTSLDNDAVKNIVQPDIVTRSYVDGIIILGNIDDEYAEMMNKANIPLVLLDHTIKNSDIISVTSDGEKGGYEITRYFIAKGHKKIGYIHAESPSPSFASRFKGHQLAMKEAGLSCDNVIKIAAWDNNGYQAMEQLMKKSSGNITAVACSNDLLAIHALKYFNDNNINCPNQISLSGFDDIAPCSYVSPSLTTVHIDKIKMGKSAVRMLCDTIAGINIDNKHIVIKTKLIERDSVEGV